MNILERGVKAYQEKVVIPVGARLSRIIFAPESPLYKFNPLAATWVQTSHIVKTKGNILGHQRYLAEEHRDLENRANLRGFSLNDGEFYPVFTWNYDRIEAVAKVDGNPDTPSDIRAL